MRKLLLIAVVLGVTALAIGVNRIVVTDGHIEAQTVAFKSEYLPLER